MKDFSEITSETCSHLSGIFTDLDDTLTTHGRLPAASYNALWRMKEMGWKVVIVTGRPAGWADHIARMWPVDGVVGENGAFFFWMADGKIHRHYVQTPEQREENQKKLEEIQAEVLAQVPLAAVSADQSYRESDLAIDFCEDVPPLPAEDIEKIVAVYKKFGAQVKVSSIHVNGWFGDFNKLSTCKLMVKQLWQETDLSRYLYCGDSPNDEPMFEGFTHSAGVANIRNWESQMQTLPTYVTKKEGGEGFSEIVTCLLEKLCVV